MVRVPGALLFARRHLAALLGRPQAARQRAGGVAVDAGHRQAQRRAAGAVEIEGGAVAHGHPAHGVFVEVGAGVERALAHQHRDALVLADPGAGPELRIEIAQRAGERRQRPVARRVLVQRRQLGLGGGQLLAQHHAVGALLGIEAGRAGLPAQAFDLGLQRLAAAAVFRHRELDQQLARRHLRAFAQRQPPHLGVIRRMHREYLGRLEDRPALHPGRPGHGKQDQQQQRQHDGAASARTVADLRPQAAPHLDFARNRADDEPAHFNAKKEQTDQLDEEVVHQQCDAHEHGNTIEPDRPGEQDQADVATARKILGRLGLEAEQALAQVPARQRKGARMQVRHVEPVGQHEVAVEAHERAGVHRQRRDPGGGGEREHDLAQHPVRQHGPGQRRPDGDQEFGGDAGHRDLLAPASFVEAPDVVGVGVRHRPQHQEGQAHRRHPAAAPLGGDRVPEFVRAFYERQRHRVGEQAAGRERAGQRGAEYVPLAPHQRSAEQQRQQRHHGKAAREHPFEGGRGTRQPAVRFHQRDAEEQVMVQQLRMPLAGRGPVARRHRLAGSDRIGTQQLVIVQELLHGLDVGAFQVEGRVGAQRQQDVVRVAERPAAQDLEGGPVDAEELVAHRVFQRMAGFPGRQCRAAVQAELFAQRRQRVVTHID